MPTDAAAAEGAAQAESKVKVKKAQLEKAIRALSQLVAKRSANANPLFGSSAETMTVLFTLSRVPDRRSMKPVLIPLPHPMFNEKSEVCFISKDPQKQFKELLITQHPVPGLTKVIGIDKLRRNYKTAESKRQLADAFDLFLCDSRVVEMMPKMLGSIFYEKKKKRPIPVRLKVADPKPAIEKAISSTALRVPSGPCVGVRFGRCSMPEAELLANAATVIAGVIRSVYKNPVQTISIQATDSPALPIWRRPDPPGGALDLKKYHSDAVSSAASDSGGSRAHDSSDTAGSNIPSDAGDTLSTFSSPRSMPSTDPRDAVSELAGDTSASELDSLAGDVDEDVLAVSENMPLVQGLRKKNKRRLRPGSPASKPAEDPAQPLGKKARRAAAAAAK